MFKAISVNFVMMMMIAQDIPRGFKVSFLIAMNLLALTIFDLLYIEGKNRILKIAKRTVYIESKIKGLRYLMPIILGTEILCLL